MTKPAARIEEVNAFRDLSDASRSLLARGLRYVQCAKGAPVLAKGQRVSGAYVVMSGRLRVFTLSPDGNEATLYVINPHETCVLALNCIFNDLLYPAWVEAGIGDERRGDPGPGVQGVVRDRGGRPQHDRAGVLHHRLQIDDWSSKSSIPTNWSGVCPTSCCFTRRATGRSR